MFDDGFDDFVVAPDSKPKELTKEEIEKLKEDEKKRRADMILSAFDELLNPEPP